MINRVIGGLNLAERKAFTLSVETRDPALKALLVKAGNKRYMQRMFGRIIGSLSYGMKNSRSMES
jgi:hypothetical protein